MPLSPESALLTTFITPFSRYSFCRLPFGITSAPEHFQQCMSDLLSGLDGVVCMIDMDVQWRNMMIIWWKFSRDWKRLNWHWIKRNVSFRWRKLSPWDRLLTGMEFALMIHRRSQWYRMWNGWRTMVLRNGESPEQVQTDLAERTKSLRELLNN